MYYYRFKIILTVYVIILETCLLLFQVILTHRMKVSKATELWSRRELRSQLLPASFRALSSILDRFEADEWLFFTS